MFLIKIKNSLKILAFLSPDKIFPKNKEKLHCFACFSTRKHIFFSETNEWMDEFWMGEFNSCKSCTWVSSGPNLLPIHRLPSTVLLLVGEFPTQDKALSILDASVSIYQPRISFA
jgi:Zn-finger protein